MNTDIPAPGQVLISRDAIFSRRLADEFWSGPVTPLTFDLLAPTMTELMVRRPLMQAGLDHLAGLEVLRLHASHVYVNAGLLRETVGLLPSVVRSDGLLQLIPEEARAGMVDRSLVDGSVRAAAIVGRLLVRDSAWAPWRRAARFDEECVAVRAKLGGPAAPPRDVGAAFDDIEHVRRDLGVYLGVVSWAVVYAYVFYHLLHELVRRWAPNLDREAAALTVGLPGVASLEAHHDLVAIGALVADDPEVVATYRDRGARAAWELLEPRGGAARTRFNEFLVRHGHRLIARDLRSPTWREAPELVLALALDDAGHARPAATESDERTRRLRATAAVDAALGGGPLAYARRAAFHGVLGVAQRYYAVRENVRYHADFFLARLRASSLAIGERLAREHAIDGAEDVFFLRLEELRSAATAAERGNVRSVVTERRASFARDAAAPPPSLLDDRCPPVRRTDERTLIGEAAAPGSCRARARIVHGPADFPRVAPGEVVVAAYADPAWTTLLARAGGIVLEAGGQLSHGAIVARELGIPALVSVADARRLIHDGDLVDVDAAAGAVRIVERGQGAGSPSPGVATDL